MAICVALAGTVGCVTHKLSRTGAREEAFGNYDKAVLAYARLAARNPESSRWAIALSRTKLRASQQHFEKAKKYNENGQLELAIGELQQVVTLDPSNSYAQTELEKAMLQWQKARATEQMTELEIMKEKARRAQGVPPK